MLGSEIREAYPEQSLIIEATKAQITQNSLRQIDQLWSELEERVEWCPILQDAHSYRHRYGLVHGDPSAEGTEKRLVDQPKIKDPTIALDGDIDDVALSGGSESHYHYFTGNYEC